VPHAPYRREISAIWRSHASILVSSSVKGVHRASRVHQRTPACGRVRKARGLSQYALAKQAGVSRVHVATLEKGASDPTVGMLARLAQALGVSVVTLLE
jgi:DNA-binding XRE family transcriptional regulator